MSRPRENLRHKKTIPKGGRDFAVVPINLDVKGPETARAFLANIGVTRLPLYSDPAMGVFNDLKRRGLALGLPTSLLIDGMGCRVGIVEAPAAWDSPPECCCSLRPLQVQPRKLPLLPRLS